MFLHTTPRHKTMHHGPRSRKNSWLRCPCPLPTLKPPPQGQRRHPSPATTLEQNLRRRQPAWPCLLAQQALERVCKPQTQVRTQPMVYDCSRATTGRGCGRRDGVSGPRRQFHTPDPEERSSDSLSVAEGKLVLCHLSRGGLTSHVSQGGIQVTRTQEHACAVGSDV